MDLFTYAETQIAQQMTADEARRSVDEIKSHVGHARHLLLELQERRGWRALGYDNWRECVVAEFGQSQSYVYFQLQDAKVERNISTIVEIDKPIPGTQLRPLAALEPEQQREAWARAVETAPEGRVTAAHVQAVVDEIKGGDNPVSRPHVANNSGNNEWYTPPEYIQAARAVMGDIDLDPASSELANRTVMAPVYFTADDDGLRYSWDGRVWMNPPYSSELIGQFTEKLTQHYLSGEITQAIVLVNNATETGWFRVMMDACSAICFPKGRIRFIDMQGNPTGAPLQGQAILYFGGATESFSGEFSRFGKVLYA